MPFAWKCSWEGDNNEGKVKNVRAGKTTLASSLDTHMDRVLSILSHMSSCPFGTAIQLELIAQIILD